MFEFVIFNPFIIRIVFGLMNTIKDLLLTRLVYTNYHPYVTSFNAAKNMIFKFLLNVIPCCFRGITTVFPGFVFNTEVEE